MQEATARGKLSLLVRGRILCGGGFSVCGEGGFHLGGEEIGGGRRGGHVERE